MTPAQLRAFAEVARTGSVRGAAQALDVSDAAVSAHVGALRRELGDELFHRAGGGLAFTPGGLRLAARAVEMLGLQDATRREVSAAAAGQRVLRVATTSLFAEHSAPGLIELFSNRADDLGVELVVERSDRLPAMLTSRQVDVVVGPELAGTHPELTAEPFLRYQVVVVAHPGHPLAGGSPSRTALAGQPWALGPSAAEPAGVTQRILRTLQVPEERQRIFQSHAAALEHVRNGEAVGTALAYAVNDDVAAGRLVRLTVPGPTLEATWTAMSLVPAQRSQLAREMMAFVTTPRALRAMISGSGTDVRRFRPSVHVTLWR